MKETLIDLKNRRSCRKYLPQQISDDELNAILEAGTYAPTGMNRQAPVIVVVQNPETIARISKLNAAIMGCDNDPFYGAPTLLIILADRRACHTWREDGALVMGNLLNAAHAVGVASCYIYRTKECFELPEGKELLREWGLDENYTGVGNCILGYAAEGGIKAPAPRKENYIIRAK